MLFRSVCIVVGLLGVLLGAQPCHAQKRSKSIPPSPPPVKEKLEIVSCDILENGDSINRTDQMGRKQGPWLTVQKAIRGEEGYSEYGEYVQDKKVGKWYRFSLTGVPVSVENYKSGKLDGEANYFEDGQLICTGHYYALHDANTIDTFLVEDPETGHIHPVYIKSNVGSVRHGLWTYYEPETQQPYRKVEYQADKVVFDKTFLTPKDSAFIQRQNLKFKTPPSAENTESVWMKNRKSKATEYIGLPTKQHYRKKGG